LSEKADSKVFALIRDKNTAAELISVQSRKPNVYVLQADIVDTKALKSAAAEVASITGGSLDYLINNAALTSAAPWLLALDSYAEGEENLLEEDLHQAIHVNVIGVIHTINAFLPLVRKSEIRKVISLTSALADLEFTLASGFAASAPYSISKAALNMAMAKYAAQYKAQGIVFLSISPGMVNTSVTAPTPKELEEFQKLIEKFKAAAPQWDGMPLSPEKSIKLMLDVMDCATVEDSGAVISQYGNKQWLTAQWISLDHQSKPAQ